MIKSKSLIFSSVMSIANYNGSRRAVVDIQIPGPEARISKN